MPEQRQRSPKSISVMGSRIETQGRKLFGVGILVLALGLLTAACSSFPAKPITATLPEYSGVIAASEFFVGENRFPFALVSSQGNLLEDARVQVRFYSLPQQRPPEFRTEAPARFFRGRGVTPHLHPGGEVHKHIELKSVYVVGSVMFDQPGFWGAEFDVKASGFQRPKVQGAAFEVRSKSRVPNVGDPVPPSRNLTLADVASIEEIETRVPPDNMHDLSVAQALQQDKPFVVVFATPMYCITRMCGPVTDIAAELHERYRDKVNFIHIEPWDLTIARGEGKLVPIQISQDWGLPTEPWVFVVNRQGRVASRFEGLVAPEELEPAIAGVLAGKTSTGSGAR